MNFLAQVAMCWTNMRILSLLGLDILSVLWHRCKVNTWVLVPSQNVNICFTTSFFHSVKSFRANVLRLCLKKRKYWSRIKETRVTIWPSIQCQLSILDSFQHNLQTYFSHRVLRYPTLAEECATYCVPTLYPTKYVHLVVNFLAKNVFVLHRRLLCGRNLWEKGLHGLDLYYDSFHYFPHSNPKLCC